jgi:hypothetical protein
MKRVIIIHWNKSTGPETMIQYPPEKDSFPKDLFLKIWTQHELKKGEKMIEYTMKELDSRFISVIHKYEGEIYFVVLVYEKNNKKIDEIINSDPDLLANISKDLIQLINTNRISNAIFEAYNSIQNYTKLEKEEHLLNFFKDKIKYTILKILRKGVISKRDLKRVLTQEYGFSTINLDLLLISYIRENLILKKSIHGSQECYFLVNDLTCIRIPPKNSAGFFDDISIDNKKEIFESYKNVIIKFFKHYDSTQPDNLDINLMFLLNQNIFKLLKLLRKSSMLISEGLNILNNNEALLNELIEKQFIFEAKGYIFLLTDVRFLKFLPTYIINRLNLRYQDNSISLNEYLYHTQLLLEKVLKSGIFEYQII